MVVKDIHNLIEDVSKKASEMRRSLQLLQFTDLHLVSDINSELWDVNTYQSFLATLTLGRRLYSKADLMLLTGDLVHEPEVSSYKVLNDLLSTLELPVYRLPGNHDDADLMSAHLNGSNIRSEDVIRAGGWQIILLDSNAPSEVGGCLHQLALKRLEKVLSDSPDQYALVCLHHHPVPVQSSWMDAMALTNSEDLFDVLDAHPQVRGLIWGHIHQEFETQRNGVRLLGAPATCIQFVPHRDRFQRDTLGPGFRWLRLEPDGRIETRVHYLSAQWQVGV